MGESSLYNKINKINNIKMQKITTSNIKQGVNIFGVNGTFTAGATAIPAVIANGFNAYVNGTLINGSATIYSSNSNSIPNVTIRDNKTDAKIDAIYYTGYNSADRTAYFNIFATNGAYISIPYNNLSRLLNIDPVNIKKGSSVLDIEGQYDASTEFQGIKMDPVVASDNTQSLITSIREISGLDTSNGTNFSGYFSNLNGVISISNLEMSNITNAYNLCANDSKLTKFEYVNMYTDSATQSVNCYRTFAECRNLISIKNTKFPKYISYTSNMFYNCFSLNVIDSDMTLISYRNNASIQTENMFSNCCNLTSIKNMQFNTSINNYLYAYMMFYNCSNLNISTLNFNNCRLTNTARMFWNVPLNLAYLYNVLNTTTSFIMQGATFQQTLIEDIVRPENTTTTLSIGNNTTHLYAGCNKLTNVNLNYSFYRSGINYWFASCQNLTDLVVDMYNTPNMAGLVFNCQNLTNLTFLNYKVNSAINIDYLCYNCFSLANAHFELPFSTIVNASQTFDNCQNLSSVNINLTNTNFIYNASRMFANCYNLKTVNITNINNETENGIIDMDFAIYSSMFTNCYNLTSLNNSNSVNLIITPKTRSSNISVAYMFANCYNMTGDFNLKIRGNMNGYPPGIISVIDNTSFKNVNVQYEATGSLSPYANIGIYDGAIFKNCHHIENFVFNMHLNSTNITSNNRFFCNFINNCNINGSADITFKITNWLGCNLIMNNTTFNNSCNINITAAYKPSTYTSLWGCGISLTSITATDLNLDLNQHTVTICNIYNCHINNLNINESYNNCYYYNMAITMGSIGNLNIDYPAHANSIDCIWVSNVTSLENLIVNIPAGAEIYKVNNLYCSNCIDLVNVDVNLSKIPNIPYLTIRQCPNIRNIDINISNCINSNYFEVSLCGNVEQFNINMTNIQNINYLNISDFNLSQDLDINLTSCININQLYLHNLKGDNFNNLTITLNDNITQIYRMYISGANASNPSNLSYINIKYNGYTNIKMNYISLAYHSKLTDNCFDNLLGFLANTNFTGPVSNKKLSAVFTGCGKTQEYFSALSNYSNLVAKGWTY